MRRVDPIRIDNQPVRHHPLRLVVPAAMVAVGVAMLIVGLRPSTVPTIPAPPKASPTEVQAMQRKAADSAWWLGVITAINGGLLSTFGVWRLVRVDRPHHSLRETTGDKPVPLPRAIVRVGVVLLVVGAVVRLPGLTHSLWYDEIHTVTNFLSGGFREIAADYSAPNNHILYTLLLKCVDSVLPSDMSRDARAVAWRMLSVVLGALAIVATALMCAQLARLNKAPVSLGQFASTVLQCMAVGAGMVVWPLAIDMSQQVRGYALVMLLGSMATALLPVVLFTGRRWAWYVLAMAAMLYTHPLSIVIMIAHVAAVWHSRRGRDRWINRRYAVAAIATGMMVAQLYALVVPDALANLREQSVPTIRNLALDEYVSHAVQDIGARAGSIWLSLPFGLFVVLGIQRAWSRGATVGLLLALPPALLVLGGICMPALRETRFLPIVAPHLLILIVTGITALLARSAGYRLAIVMGLVIYLPYCAMTGMRAIARYPVQSYREACTVGVGEPGRTVALGLGAPESVFYRADMVKAFSAADLRQLSTRLLIERLVIPYPRTWLEHPAQRELRELIASEYMPDREFTGRLRQDPSIRTYRHRRSVGL